MNEVGADNTPAADNKVHLLSPEILLDAVGIRGRSIF
jgi:hypothetical protein